MHRNIEVEEFPLQQNSQYQKRSTRFKGPLRVVRLCILGIVLPTALVSVPLYLRYHVYANQLYPFAVSDMRLLDRKISTIWCQKQLVKVNSTFNAFLLSAAPHVSSQKKELSMVRDLYLEDDMKEYWGFYLLSGTTVTISTCVRWPGASLTVIRGHKHLHECAYIGDDSSEELDELLEIAREQHLSQYPTANAPDLMTRYRAEVQFHHPIHYNASENYSIGREKDKDASEVTEPKMLKQLLDILSKKADDRQKRRIELQEQYRDGWQTGKGARGRKKKASVETTAQPQVTVDSSNVTSSEELYREFSDRLDALGDRQYKVLQRLNERVALNATKRNNSSNYQERLNVTEKNNFSDDQERLQIDKWKSRRRRELFIKTAAELNEDSEEEERDAALEEGFNSDGIADHRGFINETTLNDRSNSEFWSSFSSSEEALLNCEGLILNLPLTPHHRCNKKETDEALQDASLANSVTYQVPKNGYYFFLFNSENEVQVNYIRMKFQLNKTMYDVSESISSCSNQTGECGLKFGFFSSETVVMEVPILQNETRWNEEFIVVSECEPRTAIYVVCVISVPVLILFFAFS